MAIIANFEINGAPLKNAYFQIRRVWGSKAEGWNAQIGVAKNQIAASQNVFDMNFNVNAPYSESAPFPILYEAVRQYLKAKRIKANDHVEVATPTDNVDTAAPVPEPVKTKAKAPRKPSKPKTAIPTIAPDVTN